MALSEQFSRNVEITPSYTLTLGDSPSAAVSAAAKGSLRYNHSATRFEASVDGGAWAALGGGTISIAANQVAVGTGVNAIGGFANWTYDNATKKMAYTSSPTVASAAAAAWDGFLLQGVLTLTGTTAVTALSMMRLAEPMITAASAVTVTDAATLTIAGAPTTGGSAIITNSWALRVAAGNTYLGGRLRVATAGTAVDGALQLSAVNNGLFAPSTTTVAVTAGGTQVATFSSTTLAITGDITATADIQATGRLLAGNGTAAGPTHGFSSNAGLGGYRVGTDAYGFATAGVLRMAIYTNAIESTVPFMVGLDGTNANPAWAWGADQNTGRYRVAADHMADVTNGTIRLQYDALGNVVVGTAALLTNQADGYLYVTSCPGTPTGGSTAYAGRCQIAVDSTNKLLYFKESGVWYAAGSLSGSGVANRVAYWSGTSALTSDADFTFDGTTLGLDGPMNFLDSANPSAPSNGISLFSKANNLVSRDTDDCYHSVVPIGPSAGTATVHWEKWFRVTSAGTSTTFDITLSALNGVNTQVNNGVFWIEVIWVNNATTTYSFARQRRGCFHWNSTTSTIVIMNTSALETLEWGAAGGDMTLTVSGTADVRVTLSTSVAAQIDGRAFVRVLFADPS